MHWYIPWSTLLTLSIVNVVAGDIFILASPVVIFLPFFSQKINFLGCPEAEHLNVADFPESTSNF